MDHGGFVINEVLKEYVKALHADGTTKKQHENYIIAINAILLVEDKIKERANSIEDKPEKFDKYNITWE